MKILLYGMQSSGASVLAFTLAQKPNSLAFVDIWNMFAAPELNTDRDAVAKAVVTTAYSLEVHRQRFRPDVTLLVLRHPVDTYHSLRGKTYANESGLVDEKFSLLEKVFREGKGFDHIVHYEDFVFLPRHIIDLFNRIGWQLDFEALLFQRTQQQIQKANNTICPDIQGRLKYGLGNVQTRGLLRDRVKFSDASGKNDHLLRLCPSLFEHYAALGAERGAQWHVPTVPILSCEIDSLIRGLSKSVLIPKSSQKAGYRLRLTDGNTQCRIDEQELLLCPTMRERETKLTISGLPGRPFNRICGSAYAQHPLASGTITRIQIEGANAKCLAEQEFTLCHSDLKYFEVAFEPVDLSVSLSLGVRLADGVESTDHAAICFQDLRLEQIAR